MFSFAYAQLMLIM